MVDVLKSLTDLLAPYVSNTTGAITFQHHRDGFYSVKGRDALASKTANYTFTDDDDLLLVDATAGNVTITLPAVAGVRLGKRLTVKKVDTSANWVRLVPNGSETVDGHTSLYLLAPQQAAMIYADTALWRTAFPAYPTVQRLFTQTASVAIANNGAETTVIGAGSGTPSIPANWWRIARQIDFRARGFISETGTPTLRSRAKLGTTTLLDSGAVALPASLSNSTLQIEGTFTCRTIGGSGTISAQGRILAGATWIPFLQSGGPTTFDTTAIGAFNLTDLWGTPDPANTLTITDLDMSYVN